MLNDRPFVQVRDLELWRGGKKLFHNLSFELFHRECLAITGGSGTGKSSLMQALLGRTARNKELAFCQRGWPIIRQGEITIGGMPYDRMHEWPEWLAMHAGVLFQSGALFDGHSVRGNLSFPFKHAPFRSDNLPRRPDTRYLSALLKMVELPKTGATEAERASLLGKKVPDLSPGQQKRLALARALALKPSLLMLDEPTSGLDPDTSSAIANTIGKLSMNDGVAVLCITHDQNFVKQLGCKKLVEIHSGGNGVLTVVEQPIIEAERSKAAPGYEAFELKFTPKDRANRLSLILRQTVLRFIKLLSDGASICLPVALIAGAGLVIQAVSGPRLIQVYLAQGTVVGVFLGMGTLLPALLVIGLSASSMVAELTQRKHDDHLEYLRLLRISPAQYFGVPMVLALMAVMPLLIWISEYLMLVGGALAIKGFEARAAVTSAYYWDQIWRIITPEMWYRSAIKGMSHGGLIGATIYICGFFSGHGAKGLRRAIWQCVLIASLLIIIADVLWSSHWAG